MKSKFKPKVVTVVKIGDKRYSRASDAACEWAGRSASENQRRQVEIYGAYTIDFNDWHRRAFRRSLPIFERILGPSKNRSNPRTLIEFDPINGVARIIDNT